MKDINLGFKTFAGYRTTYDPEKGVVVIPYTFIDWIDDFIHEYETYVFHGGLYRLIIFSPFNLFIMIYTIIRVTVFWEWKGAGTVKKLERTGCRISMPGLQDVNGSGLP